MKQRKSKGTMPTRASMPKMPMRSHEPKWGSASKVRAKRERVKRLDGKKL